MKGIDFCLSLSTAVVHRACLVHFEGQSVRRSQVAHSSLVVTCGTCLALFAVEDLC